MPHRFNFGMRLTIYKNNVEFCQIYHGGTCMRRANEIRNPYTQTQLKKQLWRAVELNSYEKAVDALIDGAPIDARNEYGSTPFLWSVDHGRSKISILLLACGASTSICLKGAKGVQHIAHRAKMGNNRELLYALAELGMEPASA